MGKLKEALKTAGILILVIFGLGILALLGLAWFFSQLGPHPMGG